jgi:DNA primase
MAGKIPDDTLQAIRERVSIVEVVSGYVGLKKAGRNHIGLCPFHAEKTPSFTVNDERGLFHCFGCGAGGTVFTFLMRADRIDFREAVELLARRAGVTLPKRTEPGRTGEEIDRLVRLNEVAQRCFRDALQSPQGLVARQYLEKRGVSPATVDRYGLGFCPTNGSGLTEALASKPVAIQKAVEIGLLGRRQTGTPYDRFWGRVTFPIRDGSGQIRGFGGRTLGNEHPKYLNSPESPLFSKGRVLYGLFEAAQAVREAKHIIIVEGYLDTLALVEAGIGNAVASLGTALTKSQLELAKRFGGKEVQVTVCFDGDPAGQKAADRAFSVLSECVQANVEGQAAFLPEGLDPDSFVRKYGRAEMLDILAKARPLWDLFLERHDPGPNASLRERVRAAEEIKAVIDIENIRKDHPAEYSDYVRLAAQRLRIDEESFRQIRTASRVRPPMSAADKVEPLASFRAEESMLVVAMAVDRDVAQEVSRRAILQAFSSRTLADAGQAVITAWERENSSNAAVDQLPPAIAERVTAGLLGDGPIATGDRLQAARDCIDRIERRARRTEAQEMSAALRHAEAAGDDQLYREALARRNDLLRRRETASD